MSDTGVTVKKNIDFSEWYVEVVLKAELADYAPVKGCMIIRPDAYAVWEKIQEVVNQKIKATGHRNTYFPMFIPETFLKQEAEHFEGFTPEVAWITQGGNTPLEEKLAVRPTSETIMYSMYSKWIRSWRDLPLKINQWCNIVRWETKATKLFLRTREFLWQEGHTAHATAEECETEVMWALNMYKDIIENTLAIPVLIGTKSESEKFAGALYTTAVESIMPDGKALQMGTSHNLGQHFAKVFDVKYIGEDKMDHFVWQSSWGITTRLIGAMIMIHGDDKGLIMPPKVAPTHVVIVPIPFKGQDTEAIAAKTQEIAEILKNKGLSVILDDRQEYTPGWKFNQWELKGIPIRIELGPRDLKNCQVVIVRRDTGQKTFVKETDILTTIETLLQDIQNNMLIKARNILQEKTTAVKSYDEFKQIVESKGGFIKVSWCRNPECEAKIKEETGATIRIIPFEKETPQTNCIYCGRTGKDTAYFARSY
ncbi:MAG: proline--tRNA ligase [Nitrososphaerota archaeon]|jgi:prolyl-tRNA synthetase|nr:proline--tRNA ligase [Nitrososphaerota archaeon]